MKTCIELIDVRVLNNNDHRNWVAEPLTLRSMLLPNVWYQAAMVWTVPVQFNSVTQLCLTLFYSMDPTDSLRPRGLHMLSRLGKIFTEEVTFKQDLKRSLSGREKGRGKSKDYPEDIEKLSLEKKDNSSA